MQELPNVGDQVDTYLILQELGRGATGAVFEAEDMALQKRCALKVLLPRFAAEPDALERFLFEAQSACLVLHENIAYVSGIGDYKGTKYIVMERLWGRSLRARLEQRSLTVDEVTELMRGVAMGLAEAHSNAVVHRALEPSSIFLCTSESGTPMGPKILDFGMSQLDGSAAGSSVARNPCYLSPEQFDDPSKASARSDIYALGVVMYEALTGRVPHAGETREDVLARRTEALVPPSALADVPSDVERLIVRAMALRLEDRHQSAEELLRALDAAASQAPKVLAPARVGSPRPRTEFDDDACLVIDDLASDAKAVVSDALALCQELRQPIINNRILLAAFLGKETARKALESQVPPDALRAFLLRASRGSASTGATALTAEVSQRVLLPALRAAREAIEPGDAIDERALYRAFCRAASSDFREWLESLSPTVVLDAGVGAALETDEDASCANEEERFLGRFSLTESARIVISRAHWLAQQQGYEQIPNRVLLVAFFTAQGPVADHARSVASEAAIERVVGLCLRASPEASKFTLDLATCERSVLPALNATDAATNGAAITAEEFFAGFCRSAPRSLTRPLAKLIGVPLVSIAGATSTSGANEPSGSQDEASVELPSENEFEPAAWALLQQALELARETHHARVDESHLAAAVVESTKTDATAEQARQLKSMLLATLPKREGGASDGTAAFNETFARAVTRTQARARRRGSAIGIEDVTTALMENSSSFVGGALSSWLKVIGGGWPPGSEGADAGHAAADTRGKGPKT